MEVALRGTPEMCQVNPSRITGNLEWSAYPENDKADI